MSDQLDKHDVLVYLDRKIELSTNYAAIQQFTNIRELIESGAFDA